MATAEVARNQYVNVPIPAYRQNCRGNPACDLRYRELRRSAPTAATGLPRYRLLTELTSLVGDGHTAVFGDAADTISRIRHQPRSRLRSLYLTDGHQAAFAIPTLRGPWSEAGLEVDLLAAVDRSGPGKARALTGALCIRIELRVR